MITIENKVKGAENKNTLLSVNIADAQSVKNQSNIKSVMQPRNNYNNQMNNQRQAMSQHRQQSASQNASQTLYQSQSRTPAQPSNINNTITTDRAMPKLQKSIQKGQKVVLPIGSSDKIEVCFGWNVKDKRCDVDASAFLLGENDKVLGDDWFVFYGQTTSPDKSTVLTTEQALDRQKIRIDFSKLHSAVKKIVFVLTINEAIQNRLHFGMIKDAYVRILQQNQSEMVSFPITDYDTSIISMMMAEVYFYNGKWKVNAIGNGIAKDLAGVCAFYGVEVV